jgi:hypothetical protein
MRTLEEKEKMIETKQVLLEGSPQGDRYYREEYNKCQKYIQDLTAFGWQPTQETTERYGRVSHKYQIMARDTTMANYNEYRKLEDYYEAAKSNIKKYNSMEASTVFLLLLLFIIPGVIYITVKTIQKNSINQNNQSNNEIMQKAVTEAKKIK